MKNTMQFDTILKLSADSREMLRASDVDRVMDAAHQAGVASEFGAWLMKKAQPATVANVKAWEPE